MSYFYCENISKDYQGYPVIKNINLSMEKKEQIALLGPSGVGKTTLFHILSGVDKPDHGTVCFQGKEITGQPGQVGYMLQKDLLLPYKTVLENIALPLTIQGIPKHQSREILEPMLTLFGLEGFQNKYPHQLSGGMRQRAALLRTFQMGHDIVLLDEPFSALDAITKRKMHRWYLQTCRSLDVSTLFVTHDIDEAILLSDKIYVMINSPGEIVDIISLPKLANRPEKYELSTEFLQIKEKVLGYLEV